MVPYEATLAGSYCRLFPNEAEVKVYKKRYPRQTAKLGWFMLFMFREFPDQDYIQTRFPENEETMTTFNQRELMIWMGGVALLGGDEETLKIANRQGSFRDQQGWSPDLWISDEPTPKEDELYVLYQQTQIDEDWNNFEES